MRNFLFESIWLLSRQDRRARSETFHPKKNLILGRNHTGKSSLIKTLFQTLGARPQGDLAQWDVNTISLVQFSVDGKKSRVMHQRGYRALFNEHNELILASSSHQEWSKAFADVVGFNLVLTDRNLETVPADPKCFFLPFYINQDGSWQSTWTTFVGLQQYRQPVLAILDYFSGVKPPEYYEVSSERTRVQGELDQLQGESTLLKRARQRLEKSTSLVGPKIDPKIFELEIERLSTEVSELNRRQEQMRDKAVRERELLSSIQLQINLATDALSTYESDKSYLQRDTAELLQCPTCGAQHTRSFLDLLDYAEDARVLRELVSRLQDDAHEISERNRITRDQLGSLEANYRRVSEVLSVRRGEMKFGEIVESMSSESAFRAFEQEASSLESQIEKCLGEIRTLSTRLKELMNPKRSKEILSSFRTAYYSALNKLNLPSTDTSRLRLTSRPDLSGSGGPRSVLAYYSALWQTCRGEFGSFAIPLVIDAPQQQGQDDVNLPKVLEFIATQLPSDSQVLLGTEMGIKHEFDKYIVLEETYKLLDESDFEEVSQILRPFEEAMYRALQDKHDRLSI